MALARQVPLRHNDGSVQRYHHEVPGYNSRLAELQAAVLQVKPRPAAAVDAAAPPAGGLIHGISSRYIYQPAMVAGAKPVWHLYVVRTPRRDELQ